MNFRAAIDSLMVDAISAGVKRRRNSLPMSEIRERIEYYRSESGIEITEEHEEILTLVLRDHANVFITGGAGVGKTTFVKRVLIPELDYRGIMAPVTASTGIAGSHLNGRTIHSWAGIRTGPTFSTYDTPPADMSEEQARNIYHKTYSAWLSAKDGMSKAREGVRARIRSTEALILDEVSMIAGTGLLGYLDYFFKAVRNDERPFGGIQMIFLGDMAQLPPVDRHNGTRPDWAFLSHAWLRADVKTVELTKVFRQADQEFSNFLNRRRVGIPLEPFEQEYVNRFVRQQTEDDVRRASFLVSTNKEADAINTMALDWYPGPTSVMHGELRVNKSKLKPWETDTKIKEKIIGSKPVRETLNLRVGMPVLFCVNDAEGRFVNGTKGFFEGFKELAGSPSIQNAEQIVIVRIPASGEKEEQRIELRRARFRASVSETESETAADSPADLLEDESDHAYIQYPIIPATAITIHKSQGISLDDCTVNLSRTFAPGHVYVALSRLRTPEGLTLTTPKFDVIVDPHVMEFYRGVRQQRERKLNG